VDYELIERFKKVLENFNNEHKTNISCSSVLVFLDSSDEDKDLVQKELIQYLNLHLPEVTLLDSYATIGNERGQKDYLYCVVLKDLI